MPTREQKVKYAAKHGFKVSSHKVTKAETPSKQRAKLQRIIRAKRQREKNAFVESQQGQLRNTVLKRIKSHRAGLPYSLPVQF